MGLLIQGTPLSWAEIVPFIDHIKQHGIAQFIALYHQFKQREDKVFKWGDEIEYTIVKFDHENKKVRVSLKAEDVLQRLQAQIDAKNMAGQENISNWTPEFTAYMVESTPGAPYEGLKPFLNFVENNMMTFQAANVDEARWLYDQLTPITPIFLALSAATPIFRGYLSDVDSRWDVISASVDDRTREERRLVPLKNNKFVIKKSRYDTTDCYIHPSSNPYNDIELEYDLNILQQLLDGGIDEYLARHIAHIFIRDPLHVIRESIEQEDEKSTDHFETILTSNWNNIRFKPPPQNNPQIGWRVEFRPTEVQLTDFENTAYCCFVVLLTRIIVSRKFNFIIPISKVTENMKRAQKRDAVLKEKFHFRPNINNYGIPSKARKFRDAEDPCLDTVEMTINEIINGDGQKFPGLVSLILQFLDEADFDTDTKSAITRYLSFVRKRASGEICTLAHWIRAFVAKHPSYEKDSYVNDEITYDMLKKVIFIYLVTEH